MCEFGVNPFSSYKVLEKKSETRMTSSQSSVRFVEESLNELVMFISEIRACINQEFPIFYQLRSAYVYTRENSSNWSDVRDVILFDRFSKTHTRKKM